MKTRHLIDLDSLSLSEIGDILHMAEAIAKKPAFPKLIKETKPRKSQSFSKVSRFAM